MTSNCCTVTYYPMLVTLNFQLLCYFLSLTSEPLLLLFLVPGTPSFSTLLTFLSQLKCHFLKEAFPGPTDKVSFSYQTLKASWGFPFSAQHTSNFPFKHLLYSLACECHQRVCLCHSEPTHMFRLLDTDILQRYCEFSSRPPQKSKL